MSSFAFQLIVATGVAALLFAALAYTNSIVQRDAKARRRLR